MKKINSQGISHIVLPAVIVVGIAVIGTYMLVASHAASKPCVTRTFSQGSSGKCVQYIQRIAKAGTSTKGFKTDGKFGPETKELVKKYQASRHINPDGSVGSGTWKKLCATAYSGRGINNSIYNLFSKAGCNNFSG